MAKATITLKNGASVMIEGTREEVAAILAQFEQVRAAGEVRKEVSVKKAQKRELKKRFAASDLIIELKEEGYFDKAHALGEIAQALEGKGYIYPVTTLSGVVLGLVQGKMLGRKKVDGKWVYGK
jgi:hypothetical protein